MPNDKSNSENQYKPVACSFYDRLELLAIEHSLCLCRYRQGEEVLEVKSRLAEIKIIDKQEFLILTNGQLIRLDKLTSVNKV